MAILDANGEPWVPPHDDSVDVLAEHLDAIEQRMAADLTAHLYGTHADDRVRELRLSMGAPVEDNKLVGLEAALG